MSALALTREPKSLPRFPLLCGDAAMADNRTADAEVAMQTRYLSLVPVLVLIAGCGEKIEAQESSSKTGEISVPPEQQDEANKASEAQETNLKLHSPVGLN